VTTDSWRVRVCVSGAGLWGSFAGPDHARHAPYSEARGEGVSPIEQMHSYQG
jgi:hypothetical protein